MANWTPQGFIGQMFKIITRYIAPNGMPSPVLWGDQATVHQRFSRGVLDLRCTYRFYQFEYPFPPEIVVDFFREHYGPMSKAFAALNPDGQAQLKADLVALWTRHNRAAGRGTLVDSEYLEVIAIRGDRDPDVPFIHSIPMPGQVTNPRAQLLADRIEEGAFRLEQFARGLSDDEWNTPVVEGGKPCRTAGVIVHHVATVYPIEIDLARAIASRTGVSEVTWDVVNALNAKHAAEHRNVSRQETIELLRKNSQDAAAEVRTLADADLDRAAPFSLSYGAPVTAQFVLEDHAVRHSWHHLARLQKAIDSVRANPSSGIL
jgi:hypothetical protein